MSLLKQLVATGGVSTPPTYVDDVFSAYTYDGTGASQTIANGIDLSSKGGMVWLKDRTSANPAFILDTVRGTSSTLQPSTTGAAGAVSTAVTAFNNNGFTVGTNSNVNTNTNKYIGWTFRKAPKFFDVVTYTGDSTSSKVVAHNLNQEVGLVLVKSTTYSTINTGGDWAVWHRGNGGTPWISAVSLNKTNAGGQRFTTTPATNTTFDFAATGFTDFNGNKPNLSGESYVAYLFAHNSAADGLLQCGMFTTDASGNASVTLGWEPQYILCKNISVGEDWFVLDSSRGLVVDSNAGGDAGLSPNLSTIEAKRAFFDPTPTGFVLIAGNWLSTSSTYIYMAIRRSNKPPTSGTQVYNAIARTGTGAAATVTGVGFTPDMLFSRDRNALGAGYAYVVYDRLRGNISRLDTQSISAETSSSAYNSLTGLDIMDGYRVGADTDGTFNKNTWSFITNCFKRAAGVFDTVCYTGSGTATTITHGLSVAPELVVVKSRLIAASWTAYNTYSGNTKAMRLNTDSGDTVSSAFWNNTSPTSSVFTIGTDTDINQSNAPYIAYLFATKAGISKVGSYTGNGSSQNIDCGFAAGARFIMIKCTSTTGDWLVADSARGIVAGNDPYLKLNSIASEVATEDWVDPLASGFIVNQVASSNANVNGATYIFLAFS